MTRDQLKKIIKECLIEILTEGVGNELTERVARPSQLPRPVASPARRPTAADSIRFQPQYNTQPQRSSQVNSIVRNATKDPVLATIFADTAMTTMLEQDESRQQAVLPLGGDQATRVAAAYDPGALIGGLTGQSDSEMHARWAQAAFAPTRHLPGMSSGPTMPDFDPYAPIVPGK